MQTEQYGPILVGVLVLVFGSLLFRGMVLEWHRRKQEESNSPPR